MAFLRSSIVIVLLAASFAACAGNKDNITLHGAEPSLTENTSVSAILSDPESFMGQTLLVEGTIVASCKKMGHWIGVAEDSEGEHLRVWAEEGLAFPITANIGIWFRPSQVCGGGF